MDDDFKVECIDWRGAGYFGCMDSPPDGAATSGQPYASWARAFQQARSGNFALLPNLVELYKRTEDFDIQDLCKTLLGDAGTSASFEFILGEIGKELNEVTHYELMLDFCDAVFARGRLADVPLLLDAYDSIAYLDEAAIIPCYISELLEFPVGPLTDARNFASPEQYRAAVLDRCQQLKEDIGEDDFLVFGGERFGVIPLARMLLDRLSEPHVQDFWRRKFEASTGIDCGEFYREETIQPLSASAIVEDFLESPEAERYQDGIRYFFGHRIPD